MKKSLLALAAMGAFAGAAQAQSSVTVYGILDVGFNGKNGRVASGKAVENATASGFDGVGNESTSRLGFRGNEDLGGGLNAFFTIEVAITPNANQNFSTGGSANRQTFVGIGKKGIGSASIGTQYTPIHLAASATDPGQLNNVFGNVIYPNATGVGAGRDTYSAASNGTTFGYTVRAANSLYLKADPIAGFVPSLFYTQQNGNSNQTTPAKDGTTGYSGGTNNNSGWGIGLNYSIQKFMATANYQSFRSENPYGTVTYAVTGVAGDQVTTKASTSGATTPWGVGASNSPGTNAKDNQMYFAATYDFGILKVFAQYLDRKVENVNNSNEFLKRSAQQIGVRGFATKTIEGWASIGNGRIQANGSGSPTANFTGWQVGSNYWLSKRTNLYAIYGATGTSNVSSVAGANPASSNFSQYAVGARHTF